MEHAHITDSQKEKEIWFSALADDNRHSYDTEKAWKRFRKENGIGKRRWTVLWYAAAAVAAIVLFSAISFREGRKNYQNALSDITVEAPYGSKTKLTLPDGTIVCLNAGSKMTYSQTFGVSNREVSLNGEAYFEVAKNAEKLFQVHSKELTVTVLGTKFDFRDYDEDKEVVVSLMEGKVSLENHLREMDIRYLSPSEKMILDKETGNMTISGAITRNSKDWVEDHLFFDENLLSDIAKTLERSYDVKIRFADDSIRNYRLYGTFNTKKQTLREVLDILTYTEKIDYDINDDGTITLKTKK